MFVGHNNQKLLSRFKTTTWRLRTYGIVDTGNTGTLKLKGTFKVMEAHGRPFLSSSNSMPTALLFARPEYLYEFTLVRLLGSEVSTTLPDLSHQVHYSMQHKRNKRIREGAESG